MNTNKYAQNNQHWIVGLTGGIGSGKSTLATMLEARGAVLIDTDKIAHALSAPGQSAAVAVSQHFGAAFLDHQGAINRPLLREHIFHDSAAKSALETLIHPLIQAESLRQITASPVDTPYIVLAVPLLFETSHYLSMVDRTLLVDCSESTQIARTVSRSGLTPDTVKAIIRTQLARTDRRRLADDIIENDNGLEPLQEKAEKLHLKYLQYAESKKHLR